MEPFNKIPDLIPSFYLAEKSPEQALKTYDRLRAVSKGFYNLLQTSENRQGIAWKVFVKPLFVNQIPHLEDEKWRHLLSIQGLGLKRWANQEPSMGYSTSFDLSYSKRSILQDEQDGYIVFVDLGIETQTISLYYSVDKFAHQILTPIGVKFEAIRYGNLICSFESKLLIYTLENLAQRPNEIALSNINKFYFGETHLLCIEEKMNDYLFTGIDLKTFEKSSSEGRCDKFPLSVFVEGMDFFLISTYKGSKTCIRRIKFSDHLEFEFLSREIPCSNFPLGHGYFYHQKHIFIAAYHKSTIQMTCFNLESKAIKPLFSKIAFRCDSVKWSVSSSSSVINCVLIEENFCHTITFDYTK